MHCNVEVTVKKTVNQLYMYSTVLGAAIKCKQYSEITVESGTHVKSVKIALNIFAVHYIDSKYKYKLFCEKRPFTPTLKTF